MSDRILDLLSDWILDLTKETKQIFCFEVMSESISQSQRALHEMLTHLGRYMLQKIADISQRLQENTYQGQLHYQGILSYKLLFKQS